MYAEAAYFWSLAPSAQAQGPICGVIRRRKVPLASASVMVSGPWASRRLDIDMAASLAPQWTDQQVGR
jgi:hypothetical protein